MRLLRTIFLLLAAMLFGSLLWQIAAFDPGQVIVRVRGWDIQTTVPVVIFALLLAAAVFWALIALLRVPFHVWTRIRQRRACARLSDGLLAMHEGRWLRAQRLLEKSAQESRIRLPALLMAARAARRRGAVDEADALLASAVTLERGAAVVALERAQLALAAEQPGQALVEIERMGARAPLPPEALHLRTQALVAAGRAVEALPLLPALRRHRSLPDVELHALSEHVYCAALTQAPDAPELEARWQQVAAEVRALPAVVAAYAERAIALGLEDPAAQALEQALARSWSESLVTIYGRLPKPRQGSRILIAERWLRARPASPALLVALGRMCRTERRWSDAESYLHRAIAQGAGSEAWEVLGLCFADQGDDRHAREAFANAIAVRAGQPPRRLDTRSLRERIEDEAVPEERDVHGMPKLRG